MTYDITFPKQIIDFAGAGGMIMISAIIVIGFIVLVRYSAKILPGFLAMLFYLLLVVVGAEIVFSVIAVIPGINGLLSTYPLAFYGTYAVVLAVLTHLTRFIVVKYTNRDNGLELGDALMCGLGVAIGQAIISGMELIAVSTLGETINTYGIAELLSDRSVEEIAETVADIQQIIAIEPGYYLCIGINGMLDIIFQTGVLLLLYAIVKKGLPTFWHGIIIVMNAVITGASLYGGYLMGGNYVTITMIKVAVVILLVIVALKVDADYLGGELRSFSKLKKSGGKMPKFNKVKNK